MKIQKLWLLLAVLTILGGCLRPEQDTQHEVAVSETEDNFSGHFFNSNNRSVMTSIEIIREEPGYKVRIYWADSIELHDGRVLNNEIAVRLKNENELRLYKNSNELRVYEIKTNGYQPEDIEWTFYKNAGK